MSLRTILVSLIVSILSKSLSSQIALNSHSSIHKARLYLEIGDPKLALSLIEEAIKANPEDLILYKERIRCLAHLEQESALLKAWKDLFKKDPKITQDISLIEQIAWGIIHSHLNAGSFEVRAESLIACFLSKDAKGIRLMHQKLEDDNALVRATLFELAGMSRDYMWQMPLLKAAKHDPSWPVRLSAIQALGRMRSLKALPLLQEILESAHTTAEEKSGALLAIVNILSSVSEEEIQHLACSERAPLRMLACHLAAAFQMHSCANYIAPLLADSVTDVRALACQSLASLNLKQAVSWNLLSSYITKLIGESDACVKASACQLMIAHGDAQGVEQAKQIIQELFNHPSAQIRALAAAVAKQFALNNPQFLLDALQKSHDSFITLNLSIGLIKMQQQCTIANLALEKSLRNLSDKIMWDRVGLIEFIGPSQTYSFEMHTHLPETTDQLTRLELWQLLAVSGSEHIKETIQLFLKEHTLGISGTAAAFLIQEGDEESLGPIRELLNDDVLEVKVQAALILALVGKEKGTLNVLQETYSQANRQLKELIIQGIGSIGSIESIPFLIQALDEPFPILRIRAATAILNCIN